MFSDSSFEFRSWLKKPMRGYAPALIIAIFLFLAGSLKAQTGPTEDSKLNYHHKSIKQQA